MTKRPIKKPFSLSRSLIVWISGAVLGWALAVVTIYNLLRYQGPEDNVAPAVATEDAADHLSPEELEKLIETAPAAGGIKKPAGGAEKAIGKDRTGESAEDSANDKPEAEKKKEAQKPPQP